MPDNLGDMNKKTSPHELLLSLDKTLPQDAESWRRLMVIKCTMNGCVKDLKAVLELCPNPHELVNSRDLTGCTALQVAARFNQVEVAEVLLKYGADCSGSNQACSLALKVACSYQNEQMVSLLLKHGCDPHQKLPKVGTVLHSIAMLSGVRMAELVFGGRAKPPVNVTDDLGRTPLHSAAQVGKHDMCLWLLSHGANPRAQDARMTTPLMVASRLGNVDVMRILFLSYGVDVQQKVRILSDVDDEGMGMLHHAVLGGRYEAVHELLMWGADANATNFHSMTPLHLCATDDNPQLVPLLVSYKADLSLADSKGRSALHRAVEVRNIQAIAALLMQGADPNIQDANYRTPLLVACLTGYVEGVKMLCENCADMGITNFYGQTCLYSVTEMGNLEVFLLLLDWCGEKCKLLEEEDIFSQTVLHAAAKQLDNQFVDALLDRGCSPTSRDLAGKLPLHVAARHGSYQTVLRLAEVTPDINSQTFDGKTPFFMACEFGNREAISVLLNKGANIKDTDLNFQNSLMAAAVGGFTDIVVDLIKMGVQVNYKDKERNTALHHACFEGHLSTVKALLDHGAFVSDTNIHGQTPLDMAVDRSKNDVAVMLMEHVSWEESLSVQNKNGRSTLNRMIEKTPDAVKIVLDKCVKTSDHAPTDEEYAIEFNYKYVISAPDCECVFVTMLKHEREDLLSHPLCQSNLSYKWYTIGKAVFMSRSVLQLGLLIAITVYYFIMPRPHDSDYMCLENLTRVDNSTYFIVVEGQHTFRFKHMYIVQNVIYALLAAQFTNDLYDCFAIGRQHLKCMQFLLSTTINLLVLFSTMPPGFEPCAMHWRAISYALFIYFLKTSVMCQRLESVGVYFTMFLEVAKTMIKISFMTVFFIIAIAIPYTVMLNQEGFENAYMSGLSTFAMALGELNFRDNFVNANNGPFSFDLSAMFPICCVILNCSLMNLMIGVAVGDINRVEKQAYLSRLKTHIYYLVEAEKVIYPIRRLRLRMADTKLVVRPNTKSRSFHERVKRLFLYCEQISFIKRNTESTGKTAHDKTLATAMEHTNEKSMEKEMATQMALIEKLTKTTDDILCVLQKMSGSQQEVLDDRCTVSSPTSDQSGQFALFVKEANMVDRT